MASPVRFPAGVNNVIYPGVTQGYNFTGVRNSHPLYNFPAPDPFRLFANASDFGEYSTVDWTSTVVGTGSAALTAGVGGILAITTSATANDSVAIQHTSADLAVPVAGYQMWYEALITPQDTVEEFLVGLQEIITTPLSATDGIWFHKAANSANIDLVVSKASTATTYSAIATATAATAIHLAFYIDTSGNLNYYVNKSLVAQVAASTIGSLLPAGTTNLSPQFFVKNGGAAATKYLNVDYYMGAVEINR